MHALLLLFVCNILQVIHGHYTSDEVVLEDITLHGLTELKGRWHASFDASGGGNGDTMVDIISSLSSFSLLTMHSSSALYYCEDIRRSGVMGNP